jgi:hypothetical protein
MAKGSRLRPINPESRKACIIGIRPSVSSVLERIASAETERQSQPVSRNHIIISALTTYVIHYERKHGNLATLLTLSEAQINYNVVNHKYFDSRRLEKRKSHLMAFPASLVS